MFNHRAWTEAEEAKFHELVKAGVIRGPPEPMVAAPASRREDTPTVSDPPAADATGARSPSKRATRRKQKWQSSVAKAAAAMLAEQQGQMTLPSLPSVSPHTAFRPPTPPIPGGP